MMRAASGLLRRSARIVFAGNIGRRVDYRGASASISRLTDL